MKVKTDYVPAEVDYLTVGKVYDVNDFDGHGGDIHVDDGTEAYILIEGCAHLNIKDWTIVEE
jgi:hypothetical protein